MKKFFILFSLYFSLSFFNCHQPEITPPIDRQALVNRHIPVLTELDALSPFTVGNGEFAFTTDVTGLQTFPQYYENDIPLVTQSQWGWHSIPNVNNYQPQQTWTNYDTYGREVPYAADMTSDAAQYLRANPHRLHLGRVAFKKLGLDVADFQPAEITDIRQELDIWQGIIKSSFSLMDHSMNVQTCGHPETDLIAVHLESPTLEAMRLGIGFEFPYGSLLWGKTAYDWQSPNRHTSEIIAQGSDFVTIARQLDSTIYYVHIRWEGAAQFSHIEPHTFLLAINSDDEFSFTCHFSEQKNILNDDAATILAMSKQHWQDFWQTGGAVDLSESTDPRANELERRIVLSQYLTAIQCSGSLPPQETGLIVNSWHGKFHLEMHWWHATHFVLWSRPGMLEHSLPWYESILPAARAKAELQGYDGVRWPKMTGPNGFSSPSTVGEFLIWQQPHPIYFAELLYRFYQDDKILERYKQLVFQSAEFMASYAHWDEQQNRYVLGPPLIPAQEIYPPTETFNPAFELSYWAFGLETAQQWRERLGLERNEKWQHVLTYLSELPKNNGFYQNAEMALNTFKDEFHRNDHPTLLGAFGMLPNEDVDVAMMEKTLEQVMATWNWQRTWGWDYPLVAMTAARVGRPDIAVDVLLMDVPKNTYLKNGHNWQSGRLPLYLPGNGGLLTAVAMMAAGWDGAPDIHAPGFPQEGSWNVKYEGLQRLP